MKNIFLSLILLWIMVGCGDSNNMTLSDDGNGTRSPRISKVLQIKYLQYLDRNETKRIEIEYVYNNNLLVQKNLTKNSNYPIIKYSYNHLKQIIEYDNRIDLSFGNAIVYHYDKNLVDAKWKLPVIRFNENIFYSHGDIFKRKTTYDYMLDDNGEALNIISSHNTQTMILFGGGHVDNPPDKDTTYFYDKNGRITQIISDGVVTNFYYNKINKLMKEESEDEKTEYIYNKKGLAIASTKYEKNSSNEWYIVESNKYFYEDKKYFLKSSLSEFEQGQYIESDIY